MQLAEKKEIAQNLNERRKEMDLLEQKLQEALTELPEKKDIDELLAQLNDVGKKSGLEIAQVTPGTESNANFFAQIPIRGAGDRATTTRSRCSSRRSPTCGASST